MPSTVLELAQRHCARFGLPRPAALVASVDPQIAQLREVLNTFAAEMATRRTEWQEVNWWIANDGLTTKPIISADTDYPIASVKLAQTYLAWKWKSDKGLDYAEDFRTFELLVGMYADKQFRGREVDVSQPGGRAYEVLDSSLNQRPWYGRRTR